MMDLINVNSMLKKSKSLEKSKNHDNYKIILHNDDVTPFEYVVLVLMIIFEKDMESALNLTKSIHVTGKGIVGIYTKQKAEKYLESLENSNLENGFQLKATMEEM